MLISSAYSLLRRVGAHALYQRVCPPMGIMFMCHSIGQKNESEFNPNGMWRISPKQLELAISCAEHLGFEAVSVDAATDRLMSEPTDQLFYTLTFDDGYADNLYAALPVCQRNSVPMMLYATSGFIQRTNVAWWHVIEKLIADNNRVYIELGDEKKTHDCSSPHEKQKTFEYLSRILTLSSAQSHMSLINQVSERYGTDSREYAESLFLNEAELKQYIGNQHASLGVHGTTHCAFSSMDANQVKQELQESSDYLTSIIGSAPRHLAYPYGSPSTVTTRDFDLVKKSGFDSAVTTRHGCLTREIKNRFALPRIPLFASDTESSIMCKLSGLTTLLTRWRKQASTV